MNQLDPIKRSRVIAALVEGASCRAVSRMAGVARNTVASLLVEIGAARAEYQNRVLRNLKCERIQCDEIWSFVAAKDRNVPAEKQGQFGFGSATLVVATIKCPPNCNDNLSPPD